METLTKLDIKALEKCDLIFFLFAASFPESNCMVKFYKKKTKVIH